MISAENAEFEGATCRGRERCDGRGRAFICCIAGWIGLCRCGCMTEEQSAVFAGSVWVCVVREEVYAWASYCGVVRRVGGT